MNISSHSSWSICFLSLASDSFFLEGSSWSSFFFFLLIIRIVDVLTVAVTFCFYLHRNNSDGPKLRWKSSRWERSCPVLTSHTRVLHRRRGAPRPMRVTPSTRQITMPYYLAHVCQLGNQLCLCVCVCACACVSVCQSVHGCPCMCVSARIYMRTQL